MAPNPVDTLRVVIVGGGAIGSVLATALEGRAEVVVADRCPRVRAAFRQRGILACEGGEALADLRFRSGDVVVVATPAWAGPVAAGAVPAEVPVVSVANGFHDHLWTHRAGTTVFGVVDFAATALEPGYGKCTQRGCLTLPRRSPRDATARLAAAIDRRVIRVALTRDIDGHRWSKVLLNASLDPVAAVTGTTLGAVFSQPASLRAFLTLLEEGIEVAAASGQRLRPIKGWTPPTLAAVLRAPLIGPAAAHIAARTARCLRSTMLADLQRESRTEVEFLNGPLVATGAALGVPTPTHRRVLELLAELEEGRRHPHRSLARLLLADAPANPVPRTARPAAAGRRGLPGFRLWGRSSAPRSSGAAETAAT